MNTHFKPDYFFNLEHLSEVSQVFPLSVMGTDLTKFKDGNIEKIPAEILKLQSWDKPLLIMRGDHKTIAGLSKEGDDGDTLMSFYTQRDDLLFGEDLGSNRAVLGRLYGRRDSNGILLPELLRLSISNIRFNSINLFNCPTRDDLDHWNAALKSKWDTRATINS